jgi:hypothetical protein
MSHENALAHDNTSLHLHTNTGAQKRAANANEAGFTSNNNAVYIYCAPLLTADSVRDWQSKYANEGRGTGCLCAPIASNHELNKLAYDNFIIGRDNVEHQLSSHVFK